jgi:hypothetical protein
VGELFQLRLGLRVSLLGHQFAADATVVRGYLQRHTALFTILFFPITPVSSRGLRPSLSPSFLHQILGCEVGVRPTSFKRQRVGA